MNTFLPQSVQTRVEIEEIAGVAGQIISPAKSNPIISVAQDSMVGSYILTKTDFATTSEQLFHYLMPIIQLKSDFNFIKAREKEKWSGKELFSTILPNISLKNSKVTIKNGDIVDGFMNKTTLGGGPKSIIQAIVRQNGNRVCRDFLDNLQRLVIAWMEDIGFTIGFGDAMPKKNIRNDIQAVLEEKRNDSDEILAKAQLGLYEPYLSNKLKMAKLEVDMLNIGGKITEDIEEIVSENLPEDNNFIISVESGSKGNRTNLNQIMGVVGQRNIDGKRIPYGMSGRTLSHFTKWDMGLASRGFVYNSYMNGLTPQEFFFTSMNSRGDAIDSNIKTAETGYIQRRLIKALEDLKVEYDGTVRDASKNIVQFSYGRDGYDSIKLEHVKLNLIEKGNEEMEKDYQWDELPEALFKEKTFEKLSKNIAENDVAIMKEWNQLLKDRSDLRYKYFANINKEIDTILAPINLQRLIHQLINQFQIKEYDQVDATPKEVIDLVSDLIEYVNKYNTNNEFSPVLKILIRSNLSSKQCLFKHRLPKSILVQLFEVIKYKILYAIVNPGEMVGVIAAQSIGEPVTQLALGAYHLSGGLTSQSVVTNSGVPRIQEIINMSKEIKTPSMTVYMKPQYSGNRDIALQVKNDIEYTEIKDLLLSSEILYIPDKNKGKYEEDEKQYKVFKEIIELTETKCPDEESLSNWVLYMEFDREIMLRKNIYLSEIYDEIVKNCSVETEIQCIVSNMNSQHLTLRIRVTRNLEENEGYITFFKNLGDCLLDLPLRGIPGIKKVDIEDTTNIKYKEDGTIETIKELILRTEGSDLISVLSNKYVDEVRTTTNDIVEIRSLFGIEGVRHSIIREINKTIEEGASAKINYRHYSVLADLMTYRGKVMQIQRNGFGKSPYMGPLCRATYEVMDKILVTAGIFSEEDNMEGTSSNIVAGQGVKAGTNSFDLYVNKNLLPPPREEQKVFVPKENENSFIPPNLQEVDMDEELIAKMTANKEVRLDDYLKAIGAQSINVDDNDFNFGYGISEFDEHQLPETNVDTIEINIIKSDKVVRNKRRRKR